MSSADATERSAKRIKMNHENSAASSNENSSGRNKNKNKGKYLTHKARHSTQPNGKPTNRLGPAISTSGIHSGDIGIFVTSDKGQERKCIQELADILSEYIDQDARPADETDQSGHGNGDDGNDGEVDIEADILAELDSLRPTHPTSNPSFQKLSFITLDIPCVSFVRFPLPSATRPTPTPDPVEIVREICLSASSKHSTGPRSRYIKRLTPIKRIRKTLNNGLESLCDEVLPPHFQVEPDGQGGETMSKGCKFAIRPTIRNNNKLDRDQVIRVVADKIVALGQGMHTVDLKGYDKLVLVDVYRNVVGMSVVGDEFEKLKRFNLAEIHASLLNGD
ncbi:hypothetical protein LTR10_019631 [Elasticomyces elasticus]|uniref:THUMP domain-containing protein n=1 Tax=Exophiala sideris TaxID=1016849 RepID=A0ABR0JGE0_9EURO|nr:hypothetical protein LTR10_019631 [Elasticomyces elasticus]KAK5025793.1 hypothetical protein LTS07_007997 [Exophiala sideris]KAK5032999.1 hypothetical protein LTR13_006964 [Exophiala sideris]KAK5063484.1 hypothetical protein LTR69_004190 [Exophiala sideris]KAK5180684.1 hypothetical protein LTR44_006998 [Eurotiomycetes sp. CCFEE 6388]